MAEIISPVLTHIINLSIESSIFPRCRKWAKVIPLLKSTSADAIQPKSYRPVALLPIISKVVEKMVFCQLIDYLESNNLIHPNLHGSRSGHSTSTALLQLYDKWLEDVEEGKLVGVLLCDQSAAFDLCDHRILLEKLSLVGLKSCALNWVHSYLANRKQSCFVDGELSTPLDLPECGVPQGSVGGPLLWLLFTCDQPDVVHDHQIESEEQNRGCMYQNISQAEESIHCGELVGYVDDGAYSFGHRDPGLVSQVLTNKYSRLECWMSANKLVVNRDKTHVLLLGSKKHAIARNNFYIMAGDHKVVLSAAERLLGGHIHESLMWKEHIIEGKTSLIKQLVSRNNALKLVCRNAKFNVRLMLANGAVQSKLVYLINLWGGAQQYLINALQVQQLNAARTVCGFQCARWSRSRLLKAVGWLSVKQLIEYHLILQAHKTLVSKKPHVLFQQLSGIYPYQTRGASMGNIRLNSEKKCTQTFIYRATVAYNKVPADIKVGSIAVVKRKLKKWVQANVAIDGS